MTKDEALKIIESAEWLVDKIVAQGDYAKEASLRLKQLAQMLREALATNEDSLSVQPAQEPVAWMNDIAFSMDKELLGTRSRIVPLYTQPAPAKEWIGLSDDEIKELSRNTKCWMNAGGNLMFDWEYFGRAVEKALKEKNDDIYKSE